MKKIIMLFFITIIVFFAVTPANEVLNKYTDNEPYTYPIYPGTDEWVDAWEGRSTLDMTALLQIPENKLAQMTTEALLESVMNYPFVSNYSAYNTIKGFYEALYETFNGFRELMSREDCREVLFNLYDSTKVMTEAEHEILDKDENLSGYEFSRMFFYTSTLEFLLACDNIANGEYTENETAQLERMLAKKKKKEKNQNFIPQIAIFMPDMSGKLEKVGSESKKAVT